MGNARIRFGVGKSNGVNSSHWSVKIRSKDAFKSTCNNKRAEELVTGFSSDRRKEV